MSVRGRRSSVLEKPESSMPFAPLNAAVENKHKQRYHFKLNSQLDKHFKDKPSRKFTIKFRDDNPLLADLRLSDDVSFPIKFEGSLFQPAASMPVKEKDEFVKEKDNHIQTLSSMAGKVSVVWNNYGEQGTINRMKGIEKHYENSKKTSKQVDVKKSTKISKGRSVSRVVVESKRTKHKASPKILPSSGVTVKKPKLTVQNDTELKDFVMKFKSSQEAQKVLLNDLKGSIKPLEVLERKLDQVTSDTLNQFQQDVRTASMRMDTDEFERHLQEYQDNHGRLVSLRSAIEVYHKRRKRSE